MRISKLLIGIGILTVFLAAPTGAADLTLNPARVELEVKAGGERTFALTTSYLKEENQTKFPNARLVVRYNDWTIKPTGEFVLNPPGSTPRSAAGWLTVSPGEFILTADSTQPIRVTISVPQGTRPGVYYAAIFIEERTPPPVAVPGERKLQIKYRLGSIVYVLVPDLVRKGDLADVTANIEQDKVVVKSVLKNAGNTHLRPSHSAKIVNEAGETVAETKAEDTPVLLPDAELNLQLTLAQKLTPGKYTLLYSIDFRDERAIQVGKVPLEVAAALPKSP